MVRIVKARQSSTASLYDDRYHNRHVGKVGWVSMISENIYMVTFVKNGQTTCGLFFDDEIEVIKRSAV